MATCREGPQLGAPLEVEGGEGPQLSESFGEWDEGQRFKGGSGCVVE